MDNKQRELEREIARLQQRVADLERSQGIPQPLPPHEQNWHRCAEMAMNYIVGLAHDPYYEEDDHYFFEAVVESVYGPSIWSWIRDRPE